ncbi:MAG: RpiB/LacA/LacB family sugar-phosphate isomerase [Candidatus Latescibacteria bacterium]|nr:RpiB/LacA/LacB family sugar-phosphate isomerase [Candidatus Latescibacterota bacterium]
MNRDDLIEAIIREVKKVLAERGVAVEVASGVTQSFASVGEEPVRPVEAPAAVPAQQPSARQAVLPASPGEGDYMVGGRDLTGRQIITQKDLESFNGDTVRVMRRAVVTPLAVDYAREKGITIKRVDAPPVPSEQQRTTTGRNVAVALVYSPDFPGDKGIVNAIISGKGFHIRDMSGGDYETAVKKLADAMASGSVDFGVCIEKTGLEGPIHANRNPKIRAVHCRSTYDARAARVDYGANVIVIDSTSDPDAVISGFSGM